jgi:hypothetical protein
MVGANNKVMLAGIGSIGIKVTYDFFPSLEPSYVQDQGTARTTSLVLDEYFVTLGPIR